MEAIVEAIVARSVPLIDEAIVARSVPLLDEAARFIAGLNLQDHPLKEQRAARDLVTRLVKVLKGGEK